MADEERGEEFNLEIEWIHSPETLVMLYFLNGVRWDLDGRLQFPSGEDFNAKALEMIEAIRSYDGGAYITLNGMKVYKDPEFPDSFEIYVHAGYASPRIPEESP